MDHDAGNLQPPQAVDAFPLSELRQPRWEPCSMKRPRVIKAEMSARRTAVECSWKQINLTDARSQDVEKLNTSRNICIVQQTIQQFCCLVGG